MFNLVASDLARKFGLEIVFQFSAMLPLVDKMCDNAHFGNEGGAYTPAVAQMGAHVARIFKSSLEKRKGNLLLHNKTIT